RSSVWRGGEARFAIPWPLRPEQPALVRRIAAAMRRLPSVHLTEAVTSGFGSRTPTGHYRLSGRQFMQTEEFAAAGVDVRVLGREDGDLAVALAATPAANKLELQTSVIGPDGKGASTLTVRYRLRRSAGEQSVAAALCGSGCYRALVPELGRARSLVVELSGGGRAPTSLAFALPAGPARDASALLRRASATWRSLRSLVIAERPGSAATH